MKLRTIPAHPRMSAAGPLMIFPRIIDNKRDINIDLHYAHSSKPYRPEGSPITTVRPQFIRLARPASRPLPITAPLVVSLLHLYYPSPSRRTTRACVLDNSFGSPC